MTMVLILVIFLTALGHEFFQTAEERRRLSSNLESCSEVDYSVDVFNCYKFFDETFYNDEFLSSICVNSGETDKSINATLCEEWADNEEYLKSFRLTLVNSMYGNGRAQPTNCGHWCMYDPFNVEGDDSIGFRWDNEGGCWLVSTDEDHTGCYVTRVKHHADAVAKSQNFCPGKICEAYGDPHIYSFDEISVYTQHSIGDFILFSSDTMRVDVRLRQFIDGKSGEPWGTVSGIHATAIELIGGDCDVKFEIYNQHQIEDGDELFLFNGEEVGWDDLADRFDSCNEICPDLYELNENKHSLSLVFANKVSVSIKETWRMHGVWITAPFEAFASDETLITDKQLCMEGYRRLNCDNDTTIFTIYDYDPDLGRDITCPEVPEDNPFVFEECDEDIAGFAEEACASCASECDIEALTVSCAYDICLAPGVADEWSQNNEDLAKAAAQEIADEYCEWVQTQIEENPWLCRYPTFSPTLHPSTQPTEPPTPAGFYVVQGKQQTKCLDSFDTKCTTRAVSQYDTWNIRCCADADPGGWYQNTNRGCNVFTNSKVPDCQTGDWHTAVEVCSAAGGRLCTREELEYPSLCSAGGGCDFDGHMVWSSTEGSLDTELEEYYIVQGFSRADCLDSEDSTCSTRPVSKHQRFKVRCCADSDPGGWLQKSGCTVWTESNVPNCVSTDWDSASELCAVAGGRLCTLVELESDCSKDGGCGFNRHMVWSSTSLSDAFETRANLPIENPGESSSGNGYYIVQGKQQSDCLDSTDPKCTSRAVSPGEMWNVRCCADSDPGGWFQNEKRGCSVFTKSEVPDCETTDWSTAVQLCNAAGGRLCTRDELEYPNLCSGGGGCDFDNYMVWSSTAGSLSPVVSKYYIVQGYSKADCLDIEDATCVTRAVSKHERYKVRCCADSDPGGWMQKTGCSIYTESNVPNCVSTDWDSAVELCRAAGGRLCTREELEAPNDCSKDSGCGFNRHMVWSSTEELLD